MSMTHTWFLGVVEKRPGNQGAGGAVYRIGPRCIYLTFPGKKNQFKSNAKPAIQTLRTEIDNEAKQRCWEVGGKKSLRGDTNLS